MQQQYRSAAVFVRREYGFRQSLVVGNIFRNAFAEAVIGLAAGGPCDVKLRLTPLAKVVCGARAAEITMFDPNLNAAVVVHAVSLV